MAVIFKASATALSCYMVVAGGTATPKEERFCYSLLSPGRFSHASLIFFTAERITLWHPSAFWVHN